MKLNQLTPGDVLRMKHNRTLTLVCTPGYIRIKRNILLFVVSSQQLSGSAYNTLIDPGEIVLTDGVTLMSDIVTRGVLATYYELISHVR